MKLKIISLILTLLICMSVTSLALAQGNPPTAQEISSQIQTYWQNSQFNDLENYISTLYQDYPNYIPVILAKSFYHLAFRNNIPDALTELNRVDNAINNNPQLGSKNFREMVAGRKHQHEMCIEVYQEKGITQEQCTAAISPQAVLDEWGDTPLPEFNLIASAPNESI